MKTKLLTLIATALLTAFYLTGCSQTESDLSAQEPATHTLDLEAISKEIYIDVEELMTMTPETIQYLRESWILEHYIHIDESGDGFGYIFEITGSEAEALGISPETYDSTVRAYNDLTIAFRDAAARGYEVDVVNPKININRQINRFKNRLSGPQLPN